MRDFLKKTGLLVLRAVLFVTGAMWIVSAIKSKRGEKIKVETTVQGGSKTEAKKADDLYKKIEGIR